MTVLFKPFTISIVIPAILLRPHASALSIFQTCWFTSNNNSSDDSSTKSLAFEEVIRSLEHEKTPSVTPNKESSESPQNNSPDGLHFFLDTLKQNAATRASSYLHPLSSEKKIFEKETRSDVAKLLQDMLVRSARYIIHIHASYNNTHVTLTNSNGNVLITQSGGTVGFKKSHRGGYEAAHQAAVAVVTKAKEKGIKIQDIEIVIKGFGPGRDAAFKALAASENGWNVRRITDATPLPFNGCRPRKARRV